MKTVKSVFLMLYLVSGTAMSASQTEFTVPANSTFMFDEVLIAPSVVDESNRNCLQYVESFQNVQIRGHESTQSSIATYCPDTERSLADDIVSVKAGEKSHIVELSPLAIGVTHKACVTKVNKKSGWSGWSFISAGACSEKNNLPDSPLFKDVGVEVSGYPISVEIQPI